MTRNAAILLISMLLSAACGSKSPTGLPGPLGQRYDASEYYRGLSGTADMPSQHKKNFEAVKTALKSGSKVKHTKKVRISDDSIKVTLQVTWETMAVGDKQLILSAAIDALEFSEGTSCMAGAFERIALIEPYFDAVSVEVNCSQQDGSRHQVIGRSLYWNGSRSINEPMMPNGELTAPGGGVEISD